MPKLERPEKSKLTGAAILEALLIIMVQRTKPILKPGREFDKSNSTNVLI